jgi:hypothetical protein
MKKVLLVLALLLLVSCAKPAPRPVPTDKEVAKDVTQVIEASEEVLTYSIIWQHGPEKLIVTESTITLIPSDTPETHLLVEDSVDLRVYLQEHRSALLNSPNFEGINKECEDDTLRLTINGAAKTIIRSGCAEVPPDLDGLLVRLDDLLGKYFPYSTP